MGEGDDEQAGGLAGGEGYLLVLIVELHGWEIPRGSQDCYLKGRDPLNADAGLGGSSGSSSFRVGNASINQLRTSLASTVGRLSGAEAAAPATGPIWGPAEE